MALFTSNDKPVSGNSGSTSILAQGTKIKGDIVSECNLHIDGSLEGNIVAKSNVTIGKSGSVSGMIDTNHLVVSGKFTGNCNCHTVEILPQGRIDGEIAARELVIEKSGEFIGKSIVHKDNVYNGSYDSVNKASKVVIPEPPKVEKVNIGTK